MKLTLRTTTKLKLEVLRLPFQLYFSWNKKNNAKYDFWFTPTGLCKLWFGSCHTEIIGGLTPAKYKALVSLMRKERCDILTDGYRYYTIVTGNNIAQIINFSQELALMKEEYQSRKDWEGWEDIKKV